MFTLTVCLSWHQLVQTKYTIAPDVLIHPIHITVIKEQLTRNLAPLFHEVVKEVEAAMQELIPAKGDGELSYGICENNECSHQHHRLDRSRRILDCDPDNNTSKQSCVCRLSPLYVKVTRSARGTHIVNAI